MTEGPPASASLGREASVAVTEEEAEAQGGREGRIHHHVPWYLLGGRGWRQGAVGSSAFRFLCLMSPCCREMSPLVLF